MALVKMAEEFGGLPMESLIGGPLQAACDAHAGRRNGSLY